MTLILTYVETIYKEKGNIFLTDMDKRLRLAYTSTLVNKKIFCFLHR